jgi:pimeloyl-ACP methyl ester carboxylesterase/TM2 domain-containing membrane protein YozV
MNRQASGVKKRRPLPAAVLSLLAPGLGQVYNGELLKGIFLSLGLGLAAFLYAFRIYTDGSLDTAFFWAMAAIFVLVEIYSIVQAFSKSRRLGSSYRLKKFNRALVYLGFSILAFLVFIVPGQIVKRNALMDITDWHPFRTAKAKEEYHKLYEQQSMIWPVPSETRMVNTSWGRTHVRISGPADGPPLVLLHGASATSLMWAPNIGALSAVYRTYAPDNIYDFGLSVFTKQLKRPDDFVSWLDELFDGLELGGHINLAGQSYGGWIAGQHLIRHPDRLDKVVLLAPAMTIEPFQFGFLTHGLLGTLPFRRFSRSMMLWLLGDWAGKNEASRLMLESYADNVFLSQKYFKPKGLVRPTLLTDEELKSIKVPTLFMVGENEKIFSPVKALARLKSVAPQVRTELIPGAGHDLTLAQAELVNGKILEFLAEKKRP